MPRVESTVTVPVSQQVAFAVSQTQGEIRYRWDPFVANQRLLNGATDVGKGVLTETQSKHRLKMVSEYTSFRPPAQVGMKMVTGPWFFSAFGGGWSFRPTESTSNDDTGESTDATWRYTFTVKPKFLRPVGDRIGIWMLQRDIDKRIEGYARGCEDPIVLAKAEELAEQWAKA